MRALFLLTLCLLPGSPAYAAAPQDKLKATQADLAESKQRAASLAKDREKLEAELEGLQERLVTLAEAARGREQRLVDLEAKNRRLSQQHREAEADLASRRSEVAELLKSLIKLSRTPPEAVVAMPGELRQTLQAADLLESLTRRLQAKAEDITRRLDRLQQARSKLETNRQALLEEKEKTKTVQQALAKQTGERKQLFARLETQHGEEQRRIAQLTQQSQNLQQLLAKLEQQSALSLPKPTQKPAPAKVAVPDRNFASFTAARGKLTLPVAGRVTARFGTKNGKAASGKGLTIASREGNAILAPYGGEVVFTGPFLDYGPMVILRYDSGYHLLLAGFAAIDCEPGQRVVAGEPLGRAGSRPIYLELRKNGAPTDPAPWFG